MKNKALAHLWAHKLKASANGSSYYFRGDTIYSYGAHFPIARHVKNKDGDEAVLLTTRSRSQSTSAHINWTLAAIPNSVPVFYVLDPTQKPGSHDLFRFTERAVEKVQESRKPRKTAPVKTRLITEAHHLLEQAQRFADFFGLDYTAPKDVLKLADEWQAEIEAEDKRKAAKAKRASAKALREAKLKIAAFIAGEGDFVPNSIPWAFGRIEILTTVSELVTSKGTRVPLRGVKAILPRVKRLIESGKAWKSNGQKLPVRPYAIDEITPEGTLIAGCHRFQKEEVLRIAKLVEDFYA